MESIQENQNFGTYLQVVDIANLGFPKLSGSIKTPVSVDTWGRTGYKSPFRGFGDRADFIADRSVARTELDFRTPAEGIKSVLTPTTQFIVDHFKKQRGEASLGTDRQILLKASANILSRGVAPKRMEKYTSRIRYKAAFRRVNKDIWKFAGNIARELTCSEMDTIMVNLAEIKLDTGSMPSSRAEIMMELIGSYKGELSERASLTFCNFVLANRDNLTSEKEVLAKIKGWLGQPKPWLEPTEEVDTLKDKILRL